MPDHGRDGKWQPARRHMFLLCASIVLTCTRVVTGVVPESETTTRRHAASRVHLNGLSQVPKHFPGLEFDHYTRALQALSEGRTDRAIEHFEAVVRLTPRFCAAHIYLGAIYQDSGQLDKAEQAYLRARVLDRQHSLPPVNLSSIYLTRGENRKAVAVLLEASEIIRSSAVAFYNLGLALYRLDELAEAVQALSRARELDPSVTPQVTFLLAKVYLQMGDKGRLIGLLTAYLAENPPVQERDCSGEGDHANDPSAAVP